MMDWLDTLKSLAPTVASALLGPMAGAAVTAIGSVLGVNAPTLQKIQGVIAAGQMTPEQLMQMKELDLKFQQMEQDGKFKFAELEFKDRDSARQASVQGGTMGRLFWMSLWLISTVLIAELCVLAFGIPHGVPELVVGRVLGMLDSVAMQVLNFWFGTSHGSAEKTALLAAASPVK